MSTVKQLYDLTKELFEFIEQPFPKEERELYIEKVELLLQQREQLLSQFKQPVHENELEMAQAIVDWNKTIQQRLTMYMTVIKADMNKLKQQKDTGMKYEKPYDIQPDGFFIDKKN